MNAYKLLEDPIFRETLEMTHKGYIDKAYKDAGREPPIPKSLTPLEYADPKIQNGLNQLMQGAKNALFTYDKFNKGNN